jgi:protein-S-isoprenylcysteine O-methyltransferase Ste14
MRMLRAISFPGLALGMSAFWIWLDQHIGWKGPQAVWPGVALIVAGLALSLWVTVLFAGRGSGSPHPLIRKTKHLVIAGPFKVVRNPMMWGIGAILIGLCLALGSVMLWVGFAGFLLFIAFFVPLYEERDMERRFGEEYREYCRQVPRWLPRLAGGEARRDGADEKPKSKEAGAGR